MDDPRLCRRWYVKYPLDAYALGPYQFDEMVGSDKVIEVATKQFGEPPTEVWPDGPTEDPDD